MTTVDTQSFNAVVKSTCEAFRMGMEGQANEHLIVLMDNLSQLMDSISPENLTQLAPLLAETVSAVERKDYLWASDLLEYEITPLLTTKSDSEND